MVEFICFKAAIDECRHVLFNVAIQDGKVLADKRILVLLRHDVEKLAVREADVSSQAAYDRALGDCH